MTTSNIHVFNTNLLLYVVSPIETEQFQKISENYSHLIEEAQDCQHEVLNVFITVFDIWIALKTYDEPIVLDQNKCMNFPPSALLLRILEDSATFKSFLATNPFSLEQRFFLSYFISVETMRWIRQMMAAANLGHLVNHYVQEYNNFDYFKRLDESILKKEMNNQTVLVKMIMQNIRETNEFQFAITAAISKTKKFLAGLSRK